MNINALYQSTTITSKVVVTSFHVGPLGGGIVIGTDDRGISRRAAVTAAVLPRPPVRGEVWRFVGTEAFSREHASTFINAAVALPMPVEGEAIIRYLADSPNFPGIGIKTALRLRNALGIDGLYRALRQKDYALLTAAVGSQMAAAIVNAIDLLNDEIDTLRKLEALGIDGATAGVAFSVWGTSAPDYLSSQPYALRLLFPWSVVDARALRMGVRPDDERRLLALIEEALARVLKLGHTGSTHSEVCASVHALAMAVSPVQIVTALQGAIASGHCLAHPNGLLQSRGVFWMEREIERIVGERIAAPRQSHGPDLVESAIRETEGELGRPMTFRQREAVQMAVSNRVCALAGGAGTGKTTTLHAIARARLAAFGSAAGAVPTDKIVQAAVAGRAARRITQATGLPAVTIARLIRDLETERRDLADGLLIIDESSMLDLPTAYQLLTRVPQSCDVVFVGDPSQLPSIGPGQVFISVLGGDRVAKVELDLPQRQSTTTGIPEIAQAIREGIFPDIPEFDPMHPDREGVFILPTGPTRVAISKATLSTFATLAGPVPERGRYQGLIERDVQILCATKNGVSGAKDLSREIEDRYTSRQIRAAGWGLSIGSKILWLKNDYDKAPVRDAKGQMQFDARTGRPEALGLMNGCLGVVRRHSDGHETDTGAPGSWIEFEDGVSDWIYEADLPNLTLGWAVTVHKAQGSAFQRVVVPLPATKLTDRALIYTAITRAVRTCVLVGNPEAIRAAVEAVPRVQLRRTCLSL